MADYQYIHSNNKHCKDGQNQRI